MDNYTCNLLIILAMLSSVCGLSILLHTTYWKSHKPSVKDGPLSTQEFLEAEVLRTVSDVLQDLNQIVQEIEQSDTNMEQVSQHLKHIRKDCKQALQTIEKHPTCK